MRRSAIPSPFTSPALLTASPEKITGRARPGESRSCHRGPRGRGSAGRNSGRCSARTPHSSPRRRWLAPSAPMRRSASPSPLTSPAPLTAKPEPSPAATPFRRKPFVPSRLERPRPAGKGRSGRCSARRPRRSPRSSRRWGRAIGPDEEVRKPIAVDIPRTAHRLARAVTGRDPVQAKAVRTIEDREVEGRGKSRRPRAPNRRALAPPGAPGGGGETRPRASARAGVRGGFSFLLS